MSSRRVKDNFTYVYTTSNEEEVSSLNLKTNLDRRRSVDINNDN